MKRTEVKVKLVKECRSPSYEQKQAWQRLWERLLRDEPQPVPAKKKDERTKVLAWIPNLYNRRVTLNQKQFSYLEDDFQNLLTSYRYDLNYKYNLQSTPRNKICLQRVR